MFRQLYDWIQNIAVYLIVVSAVMHAVPGKPYRPLKLGLAPW